MGNILSDLPADLGSLFIRYVYTSHVSCDIPRGGPSFSLLLSFLVTEGSCSGGGTAEYISASTERHYLPPSSRPHRRDTTVRDT